MTLDQDRKRREDVGRYEASCVSTHRVNEQPPSAADDEYDEVMIESENSSAVSSGRYKVPDKAHLGRPSVPPPGGYEEPDVIDSEQPPTPGSNRSRSVTSATTFVYQEVK